MKRRRHPLLTGVMAMAMGAIGASCVRAEVKVAEVPDPAVELPVAEGQTEHTAIFAGGCFWCTEAVFERVEGVKAVISGYAGGTKDDADYKLVSRGATDHAEAIAITYDPSVISYGELMKIFFTVAHDPTTLNRQGNDVGRHYRSAIFYTSEEEKSVAGAYIDQLQQAGVFGDPIVTTLEPIGEGFFVAEGYHQNYAELNPNQPYIVFQAMPKVEKLEEAFPDHLAGN
ncbi:MAG: peptide-methionine (S)-S-oxide reductase MsrA [Planctomycetota bacterium]